MATIKDVSKACGVSTATVSYVLNGKGVLLPETRAKVLHAMRELNFHPNAVARGLSRKKMNTVGILFGVVDSVAVVTHPYSSFILQGVLTACSQAGYNMMFFTDPWHTADASARGYQDQRTDGIVVVAPPTDSDIVPGLSRCEIPMVAIAFPGEKFGISAVDTDNAEGIRLGLRHLIDLGHKRIAHLTGSLRMYSGQMRREAFLAIMAAEGLEIAPEYVDGPGEFSQASAYAHTRRLLTMPIPPTAIIAANDQNALGAIQAAHDLGISVPVRLSVVGFDDTAEGAMTAPGLTSIRQPLSNIGEMAVRLLLRQLTGEKIEPRMHLLEPKLVLRGTTAPPY